MPVIIDPTGPPKAAPIAVSAAAKAAGPAFAAATKAVAVPALNS